MRKTTLVLAAIAAIATPLTFASSANAAGTPRCQSDITIEATSTTDAKFTVLQPKDTVDQFNNVWTHVYTIKVDSFGAFTGTGNVTANGVGEVAWTETIEGLFIDSDGDNVSDHVTLYAVSVGGGVTYKVTNAPMDSTTVLVDSNWTANVVQFQIAQPVFETVTVNGETDFANHGEYVAAVGGGSIAAQKCEGMPLVSKQGK